MKKTITIFIVALLAGCAFVPDSKPKNFQPIKYTASVQDDQQFANIKLTYERHGKRKASELTLQIDDLLERSPEAAEFFLEKKLFRSVDANYSRHLNEKALRTLVNNQNFDPYIQKYWDGLRYQKAPYWFKLDFAIPATKWVATYSESPSTRLTAQKLLMEYYQSGCPEYEFNKSKDIFSLLMSSCTPDQNEVKSWFMTMVIDNEISQSEKFYAAHQLADKHFNQEQYEEAAAWYLAAITLSSKDQTRLISSDVSKAIRMVFYSSLPIDMALKEANKIIDKAYDKRVEQAQKRVELIARSGVKTLPAVNIRM